MPLPFDVTNVLSVCILTLLAGYVFGTWKYEFFSQRKVAFIPPLPFMGNMVRFVMHTRSFPNLIQDWYRKLRRHSYGGVYYFLRPVLILRDPHLIKRILMKDFDYFMNNGNEITEDIDPLLGKSLICRQGKSWRRTRSILNPVFAPNKIKHMMAMMTKSAESLVCHIKERYKGHGTKSDNNVLTLNVKDAFRRFVTDVIASSAFGIDEDSSKNVRNTFCEMGKAVNYSTIQQSTVMWCYRICFRLMVLLKKQLLPRKVHEFFRLLVHDTISARKKEVIVKPDVIHLLLRAQSGDIIPEMIEDDQASGDTTSECGTCLTDDELVAQALLFPTAGLEPTATLLCWTAQMLATHQDIQMQLSEEIDHVLGEKDCKLTYEKLQKMKYLDMIISETLRLFPPIPVIERRCVKTYLINGTGPDPSLVVKKGQAVWIPVFALHRDSRYFPDSERFVPERFREDNKHMIQPFTYLPFGAGPRNCIGSFFAVMLVKVAIVHLLTAFTMHSTTGTKTRTRFEKKQIILTQEGGFWLKLKPIEEE